MVFTIEETIGRRVPQLSGSKARSLSKSKVADGDWFDQILLELQSQTEDLHPTRRSSCKSGLRAKVLLQSTCACTKGPMHLRHGPCLKCVKSQKVRVPIYPLCSCPVCNGEGEGQEQRREQLLETLAVRAEPVPPKFPAGATLPVSVSVYSISGQLLTEAVVDSVTRTGDDVDSRHAVHKLKSQLVDITGIPRSSQRLVVDDSWLHATLVQVPAPMLLVKIEESTSADLCCDGNLAYEAACHGKLEVTVLDAVEAGRAVLKLTPKVHPSLNKVSFNAGILALRDRAADFRQCHPTPLLKWQLKSKEADFLPVRLACSVDAAQAILDIELNDENIIIEDLRITLTQTVEPLSISVDIGEAWFQGMQVQWHIPALDLRASKGRLKLRGTGEVFSITPVSFSASSTHIKWQGDILECYSDRGLHRLELVCERVHKYTFTIR
eukprot:TRINITY_DN28904_c0_g1_i3.p1 TRINITY_DN28904_c0_g1~~TRINITY_DN28904_c0_g1_i3.p1  ORF type:complete len:438 (+),score=64.37 TRINITY_DN28904_c0_g1_i3:57-1370(+)